MGTSFTRSLAHQGDVNAFLIHVQLLKNFKEVPSRFQVGCLPPILPSVLLAGHHILPPHCTKSPESLHNPLNKMALLPFSLEPLPSILKR